jgi:hypothetical protein
MIDSLAEYLLVEQDEYRIEQYVKQAGGRWLLSEETSLEGAIDLSSVECRLALKEVYERVDLSQSEP